MVKTGDVIENPVTGETIEFLQTTEDTAGAWLQVLLTVKADDYIPVSYIRPKQNIRLVVKSGTLGLQINGLSRTLKANLEGMVSAGEPHVWWNDGVDDMKTLVEFHPALRTAEILTTLFALARAGKTNKKGAPSLLQLAVIARKYGDELYLASLPVWLQKLLFTPLAWIGQWLGYCAEYPVRTDLDEKAPHSADAGIAP
jgi:hypothetical protein